MGEWVAKWRHSAKQSRSATRRRAAWASFSGAGQITIDYATGGDCCVVHDAPGCDFIDVEGVDPQDVEDCVCGIDSFCCEVTWDEACLFTVEELCGIECPLCPSIGTNDDQSRVASIAANTA